MEDLNGFCADVLCALEFGACGGTNMTVVGVPGSGKSMLFEPFDLIFQVIPTDTYIDKHMPTCIHAVMHSVSKAHAHIQKR